MRSAWRFKERNMEFKGYSSIDTMGYEEAKVPAKMFRNSSTQAYNISWHISS